MTLLLKSYNLLKSNKGNTIYSQQLAVNNSYLVYLYLVYSYLKKSNKSNRYIS